MSPHIGQEIHPRYGTLGFSGCPPGGTFSSRHGLILAHSRTRFPILSRMLNSRKFAEYPIRTRIRWHHHKLPHVPHLLVQKRGMLGFDSFPTSQSGRSRSAIRLRPTMMGSRPPVGVVVISPCRLGRSSRHEGSVESFDVGIL